MASFKIVPLQKHDGIDRKTLENGLEAYSALNTPDPRDLDDTEEADLRKGPLPHTLESFGRGIHGFEYGYQEESTITDLEGNNRRVIQDSRLQVIFLGNGYLVIDAYCKDGVQQNVLDLISRLLETEVVYETIEFDDETLRDVIDQAERVEQADFDPATEGMPDKVSGRHRSGLRKTTLWRDLEEEPIEKVGVNLPGKVEEKLGFKDNGIITIYGNLVPAKISSEILRHVTDEVVSNLDSGSYQKRLGGVDT